MGVLTALFEKPDETRAYPPQFLVDYLGGTASVSGVTVSETTADKYTAFYSAIDFISRGIAQLPLFLYERVSDEERKKATKHPLYELLHTRPNPEQTAFIFRQTMQSWTLRWGNAYAEIVRDGAGRPAEMWHLRSDRVQVARNDANVLTYNIYNEHGQIEKVLTPDKVLHIRTMGDGMVGYSPVRLFREAIGVGLATEQHGAAFFGNGAAPGGVLEHPGVLSEKAVTNLRASWKGMHGGPDKAFTPAILQEDMKWKSISIPNEDAQFLETRTFQIAEMARIFHLPVHKLGELTHATFTNIEHQAIEYVQDCLDPWLISWEQEFDFKLLSLAERSRYYAEFCVDGLLRGDSKSRNEANNLSIMGGWRTRNEVRRQENLKPLDGLDEPLVPMNMTTPAKMDEEPAPEPEPEDEPEEEPDDDVRMAHRGLLLDLCQRVCRRRDKAAAKGDGPEARRAHVAYCHEALTPAIRACAAALGAQAEPAAVICGLDYDATAAQMADTILLLLTPARALCPAC